MAGARTKIARAEREEVQKRILAWVRKQPDSRPALARRLKVGASQLHALINDPAERFSLEYLLDVWGRCGGGFALVLTETASTVPTPAHVGLYADSGATKTVKNLLS
jgi:hypothetical protein